MDNTKTGKAFPITPVRSSCQLNISSNESKVMHSYSVPVVTPPPTSWTHHVVTLRRSNHGLKWGLSLAFIDNQLIITDVRPWHMVTITSHWMKINPSASAPLSRCSGGAVRLLPGDMIKSINNLSTSKMRGHLAQATQCFVENCHLQLVVLRKTQRYVPKVAQIKMPPLRLASTPTMYHNQLFHDDHGRPLQYSDNQEVWDPDLGRHSRNFVRPIHDFTGWLATRKLSWRKRYNVFVVDADEEDRHESSVAVEFWRASGGFCTWKEWLAKRKIQWKSKYSWHERQRKLLHQDHDRPVSLSNDSFSTWLRVRKNQWKIARRQRLRRLTPGGALESQKKVNETFNFAPEIHAIDAILEQEEEKECLLAQRPPFNASFIFDATLGCPDDVVVHILRWLPAREHIKLLSLDRKTRKGLSKRPQVFRQLCPAHWKLPRRPRKPWHDLYFQHLRKEILQENKALDDVLLQASQILLKGDQLQAIEKLVNKAEKECKHFDINYTSGVVCERNSFLNLATIHERVKVVKWLVDTKKAYLETADRGQFTPLLNAAWGGNKCLVRYFMQRGANRQQIGTCHYTKPLALPDFEGLTAEGWALRRNHPDIASLIRIGL